MTPKEKHLIELVKDMEKEDREYLSKLRQKFEKSRELFCKSEGGHFWEESYLAPDPRVMDPYRQSLFKKCIVCCKVVVVKEDVK